MAHTDPDMTRSCRQKGHAHEILRANMMLPFSVERGNDRDGVREARPAYRPNHSAVRERSLGIL